MPVEFSYIVLRTGRVNDLLSFYQCLGVRFLPEKHGDGPRHYSATLGTTVFEIYPTDAAQSRRGSGVILGLKVRSVSDALDALTVAGAYQPIRMETWEKGRASVRDPDGHIVHLHE